MDGQSGCNAAICRRSCRWPRGIVEHTRRARSSIARPCISARGDGLAQGRRAVLGRRRSRSAPATITTIRMRSRRPGRQSCSRGRMSAVGPSFLAMIRDGTVEPQRRGHAAAPHGPRPPGIRRGRPVLVAGDHVAAPPARASLTVPDPPEDTSAGGKVASVLAGRDCRRRHSADWPARRRGATLPPFCRPAVPARDTTRRLSDLPGTSLGRAARLPRMPRQQARAGRLSSCTAHARSVKPGVVVGVDDRVGQREQVQQDGAGRCSRERLTARKSGWCGFHPIGAEAWSPRPPSNSRVVPI